MLPLKRPGRRLSAQGVVEYGLAIAVIALVVMVGAAQLSAAEAAYFGATSPSLAPPAPTFAPIGAATNVTVASVSGSYGGTVTLTATLKVASSGVAVNGEPIYFTINSTPVCGGSTGVTCPTTNSSGIATLSVNIGTTAPGTYSSGIGAQFVGDAAYIASSSTGSLTVSQASQTIMFTQPASPAAYRSNFTVAPTASSGLPVTVSASGGCTVSGSGPSYTVTMTSASTACQLVATQAGDANYSAALNVTVVVSAAQAGASVTITNTSQTYNGSASSVTVTTNPTGLSTFVAYSGSGYGPTATPPSNSGSYSISVNVTDPNYTGSGTATLVISPRTTQLSVNPATGNFGSTVNLQATLTDNGGTPIAGATISLSLNGTNEGTAVTNSSGVATLNNVSLSTIARGTYANGVGANFAGDSNNTASSSTANLTVN